MARQSPTGLGNLGRSLRFRESVSLLLRAEGISNAVAPMHRSLASAFNPENPSSDILGIPNFSILTRSEVARDLSGGLNAAIRAAADDGSRFGFQVWERHSYATKDAFVVTDLDTLARLVKAVQS